MQRHAATVCPVGAKQQANQLGAARSDQPGNAKNFTGPQLQAHVLHGGAPAQAFGAHHHRADGAARAVVQVAHHAAHHALHQVVFARARHGAHVHQAAVTQHGHAVGNAAQFLQPVRHVDDGQAAR